MTIKLNKFLWSNFLESAQGRESVEFFSSLKEKYTRRDEGLHQFISSWESHGTLDKDVDTLRSIDAVLDILKELRQTEKEGTLPADVRSRKEADAYFKDVGQLVDDEDEDEDLFYCSDIPALSVALFCLYPKFFFPYYFYLRFHTLKAICDEFGIFLPPVPPKADYDARFYYYLELCKSLYDYWETLGFSPEHLPAFLYGFAPEALDLRPLPLEKLPKPKRAWFIGGGINNNGDFDYLDRVDESSRATWQGNKDTEEGDIVVMYCLTPRSHIHSIWRAIRPGSVEPFFGFYSIVSICHPQLVVPVSLSELRNDPILSEMPLVKGNMQGINGRNIPKRFYDRLLALLKKNGTKVEIPQLLDGEISDVKLKTERDVEVRLLEPLLEELGFAPTDWERQVRLRVGRTEKAIPDYLIHISRDKTSKIVKADWVWEAKFSIPNHRQLQMDFAQVCSYGRLVEAAGVGLISKEGVWTSSKSDDYSIHKARHWSAKQATEVDGRNEIRAIAGKRSLRSLRDIAHPKTHQPRRAR